MPHRAHLTTVRIASAIRDAFTTAPYTRKDLGHDVVAGITVGIIAIPLAMALAIAIGAPPQYGLYSAVIAGAVAALSGGSRFSISGPTAAFVVVLAPVVHRFGLGGLAVATVLAGLMLVALGLAKMGRLIEYVPEPVTVGFTAGIATVLAVLQLNDLLGLGLTGLPEHFIGKATMIASSLTQIDGATAAVGLVSLAIVMLWPRDRLLVPGHVPALVVGAIMAVLLARSGHTRLPRSAHASATCSRMDRWPAESPAPCRRWRGHGRFPAWAASRSLSPPSPSKRFCLPHSRLPCSEP